MDISKIEELLSNLRECIFKGKYFSTVDEARDAIIDI